MADLSFSVGFHADGPRCLYVGDNFTEADAAAAAVLNGEGDLSRSLVYRNGVLVRRYIAPVVVSTKDASPAPAATRKR